VSISETDSAVTLVEGADFCISGRSGDISPRAPHGLFHADARLLSEWALFVDGRRTQPLSVIPGDPLHVTLVTRAAAPAGQADSRLLVQRDRYVSQGMREDILVRNLSTDEVAVHFELFAAADFADVFAVKEGRAKAEPVKAARLDPLTFTDATGRRGVVIRVDKKATMVDGRMSFDLVLAPRSEWCCIVQVHPVVDGVELESGFPNRESLDEWKPVQRMRTWRRQAPTVTADDPTLRRALERSLKDLGSLRIQDPSHPETTAVAAGAPWFMALFGRDALIASWMSLLLDPGLALGTLQTLARHQGKAVDPATEEEPGRILHEVRFGPEAMLALGGRGVYYGSVDATPLFVMLLGELYRWGAATEDVVALLPHADQALEWICGAGDRDGDGFVEYARSSPTGLANQGWKDSWDAITFADGTLAEPPIALAEVQGYAFAAMVARARCAAELGDHATAELWSERAERLRVRFEEAFWMPERGCYALALDRNKRQVDSVASNMAHCLWTGIVSPERAESVAAVLRSPQMSSGWGLRTLSTDMGAYNPMSYHNGSVWPHDTAIAVAGLMRYGFTDDARRLATELLDAAEHFDGRLPELICGFSRDDYGVPVPYPSACSPQAWAAATPVQLVRSLLRLDPHVPGGVVSYAPQLPPEWGELRLDAVDLAGVHVSLRAGPGGAGLTGLPDDVTLSMEPRPPTTHAPDWMTR
jgi:glycogen debranching enzyme